MRISRPCYDKYWRCPGWAGGGFRYARLKRCEGGSLARVINFDSRWWIWKTHRCPECAVVVLPYMARWLDPTWWSWSLRKLTWKFDKLRWWFEDRRSGR